MQCGQDFFRQRQRSGLANALQTRANAASSRGDFFVRRALDALLEIHQARADKKRVRVRVHESRQHNFLFTVDLSEFLAILLQPGIAQGIFRFADGSDSSSDAEDGGIFDNAEFFEFRATARAGLAGASDAQLP